VLATAQFSYPIELSTALYQNIAQQVRDDERDAAFATATDVDRPKIHRKPVLNDLING